MTRTLRSLSQSEICRNPDSLTARSPLLQPVVHRVVPQHAVLRLQDPVVLVREAQELARNPAPLRNRERGDALLDRDAEILIAVDDENRRFPLLDVVDRIPLLVAFRILEVRLAVVLPFVEPEFLGR